MSFTYPTIEHQAWPKIARLNRDIVVTEKIDGTNAAVGIMEFPFGTRAGATVPEPCALALGPDDGRDGLPTYEYLIYAQSRKKIITPQQDNHGFARWVWDHGHQLAWTLGPGLHFGEWWGSGIERGYGLQKGEKRFSLFNTPRYGDPEKFDLSPLKDIGVSTVPVIYEGPFKGVRIDYFTEALEAHGSYAAPGFMNPEGIIVFHVAAQVPFKVTLKGDEKPKGSTE